VSWPPGVAQSPGVNVDVAGWQRSLAFRPRHPTRQRPYEYEYRFIEQYNSRPNRATSRLKATKSSNNFENWETLIVFLGGIHAK
jgi:hypothetical protein